MTCATHYCPDVVAVRDAKASRWSSSASIAFLLALCVNTFGQSAAQTDTSAAARAGEMFSAAQRVYHAHPAGAEAGWHFARACFDWAEFATNDNQRAHIARLGIEAGRTLLVHDSNSVPGHYYLGMNLGQLARTKSLGALPIVDEMEVEFKAARGLDETFDFAGPDRNLGLLYLEAPSIGSIGSRSKARLHLKRAVELAPEYPENRLNLIEASLRYRDTEIARREFAALETELPQARTRFSGILWESAWADWERRLKNAREKLWPQIKPATSPKGEP